MLTVCETVIEELPYALGVWAWLGIVWGNMFAEGGWWVLGFCLEKG